MAKWTRFAQKLGVPAFPGAWTSFAAADTVWPAGGGFAVDSNGVMAGTSSAGLGWIPVHGLTPYEKTNWPAIASSSMSASPGTLYTQDWQVTLPHNGHVMAKCKFQFNDLTGTATHVQEPLIQIGFSNIAGQTNPADADFLWSAGQYIPRVQRLSASDVESRPCYVPFTFWSMTKGLHVLRFKCTAVGTGTFSITQGKTTLKLLPLGNIMRITNIQIG